MAGQGPRTDRPPSAAEARAARLKAALKANLARRKSQARARAVDVDTPSVRAADDEQDRPDNTGEET